MSRLTAFVVAAVLGAAGTAAADFAIDFDDLVSGDPVGTLEGVQFTTTPSGVFPRVSSGLATTSNPNYLGADGNPDRLYLPGDVITLTFPMPVSTFSVTVLSTQETPVDAFELWTIEGSDFSGATPDQVIAGDEVYLLGLSSSTPISVVELRARDGEVFAFHIDDVVPEPGAPLAIGSGCMALASLARRRRRSQPAKIAAMGEINARVRRRGKDDELENSC